MVADAISLPVHTGVEVQKIEILPQCRGFGIHVPDGMIQAQFVIWAAGEFQDPNLNPFPGADLCLHNAQVDSWTQLQGDEFTILGGYESGMDAAVNLVALGKKVKVLDYLRMSLPLPLGYLSSALQYAMTRRSFALSTSSVNALRWWLIRSPVV